MLHFDRYHKYTLGTDLRTHSRRILERITEANESRDRRPVLEQLRQDLERLTRRLFGAMLRRIWALPVPAS